MGKLEKWLEDASNLAMRVAKFAEAVPEDRRPSGLGRGLEGLQEAAQRTDEAVFDVAVIGEMKAGKSTLLNALVGSDWFPTSPTTCTAKLTLLDYADTFEARAKFMSERQWTELEARARSDAGDAGTDVDKDAVDMVDHVLTNLGTPNPGLFGTEKDIPEKEIEDYVTVKGKFTGLVDELHLQGNHPFGPHIRIVDTPGLQDPNGERVRVTQEYLAKASVVVVLLYAGAPMGEQDYQLLRRDLLDVHAVDKMIVVVNKMDGANQMDRGKIVEYVDSHLSNMRREVAGKGSLFIDVLTNARALPVSGLLGLLAARKGKIEDASFHEPRLAKAYGFSTYDEAWEMSGVPVLKQTILDVITDFDGKEGVRRVLRKSKAVLIQVETFWKDEEAEIEAQQRLMEIDRETLEKKRRNAEDALITLSKNGQRIRQEVREEERNLCPRDQAIDTVLRNIVNDLKRVGEDVIGNLGTLDAGSNERILKLNNDLGWLIRESSSKIDDLFSKYKEAVGERIPDLLERKLSSFQEEIASLVDHWVIQRVSYAKNLRMGKIRLPDLDDFAKPGFWQTALKPGQTRERLRKELLDVLVDWEKKRSHQIITTLGDLGTQLERDYWGPALDQVTDAVERYKRIIETEQKKRRKDQRDLNRENSKMAKTLQVARAQGKHKDELMREINELTEILSQSNPAVGEHHDDIT